MMNRLSIIVILVVMALSLLFNYYLVIDGVHSNRANELLKMQLNLMDQQVTELDQQVLHTQIMPKVNMDTLRYAAYTEGYNAAIQHIGKNGGGTNGYVSGYHAAIFDQEQMKSYSTTKSEEITKK